MIDRLANVIFWTATTLAAGLALGGLFIDGNNAVAAAIVGALIFLAGRAVRYVLSDR